MVSGSEKTKILFYELKEDTILLNKFRSARVSSKEGFTNKEKKSLHGGTEEIHQ